MASGPVTSRLIDGEAMETVTLGSKISDWAPVILGSRITADGDFSHRIKRHLPLRRKAIAKLDRTLNSRHITLPTKVHIVIAMGFFSNHVWM